MRQRYALIGTGHRSEMYFGAIAGAHAGDAELVAMADSNPGRMQLFRETCPAFAGVPGYGPEDIEQMIAREKVDRVIITSPDRFHAEHTARCLRAGADVVLEKPMAIDAAGARAIRAATEETGREVVVTFNYRYSPRNSALKEVIRSGRIGDVLSVSFEWVLDTAHGADYFRRWHRDKTNSGGLLIHKASHHFDLVNWWLGARPERVYARGGLMFYGQENARARGRAAGPDRGTHDGSHDPFELDLRGDDRLRRMYLDQEHHDGYRRDQDVFGPGITTEDNLAVIVDYAGGPILSYSLNAHAPWEGYRVAVNGTEGRAELDVVERAAVRAEDGGSAVDPSLTGARDSGQSLTVQRHFQAAETVEIVAGAGGHGGGDALLLADVFRGPGTDPLGRSSDEGDGLAAVAVGICGNESLATGSPVTVREHLGTVLV